MPLKVKYVNHNAAFKLYIYTWIVLCITIVWSGHHLKPIEVKSPVNYEYCAKP